MIYKAIIKQPLIKHYGCCQPNYISPTRPTRILSEYYLNVISAATLHNPEFVPIILSFGYCAMLVSYSPPVFESKSFTCPHCGVFTRQDWGLIYRNRLDINNGRLIINQDSKMGGFRATSCEHCAGNTIWHNEKMIYPFSGIAMYPNEDMPEDVREDFLQAREIMFVSPKSAAALLRLALKKLCVHLNGKGENIDDDINMLIEKGLPPKLVQALHSLRVYGKHSVEPGHIDESDDEETVQKLLAFVNIICDNQITQPKLIEQYSGQSVA